MVLLSFPEKYCSQRWEKASKIPLAIWYCGTVYVYSGLSIENLVFCLLPVMCTCLIPVFMIKEGDKNEAKLRELGYDVPEHEKEEPVPIMQSIKKSIFNKPMLRWNIINSTVYFGLQMFLVSMNALIVGLMGLQTIHMTILNTFAFAPIPIMLYLFNKSKA